LSQKLINCEIAKNLPIFIFFRRFEIQHKRARLMTDIIMPLLFSLNTKKI
jgi:hypothetical protein